MTAKASAQVRMYRLNELGDCFLVTFSAATKKSHLLIDCGSFRNGSDSVARLEEITTQMAADLDGAPIDVVVGTHQHNDHLSGFVHCRAAFEQMGIDQVWLSWLDDPRDRIAREIGKAHKNLLQQLVATRDALRSTAPTNGGPPYGARAATALGVLDDMLGFFGASAMGAAPELPAKGLANLKQLGAQKPRYLRPGQTLDMPGLPAGSVRVHVLGPPRDTKQLYRVDPRDGETYDPKLAATTLLTSRLHGAAAARGGLTSREEEHYPFSARYKVCDPKKGTPALAAVATAYAAKDDAWRRVDDDWMQQAGALALYLDDYTNNSSLALAIELVHSGKVLLFAADAQTGNWASWADVKWMKADVTTDDLLARTVFYKVGHHASHNATLVQAFEKMDHPELVAFIPVHKQDPNIKKKGGWKMPAKNLMKRIVEKTDHRVLQMDGDNEVGCDPASEPAKSAWTRTSARLTPLGKDDLSIVLDIPS